MLAIILLGCIAIVRCAPTEQGALASAEMALANMKPAELNPLQPLKEYLILTPEAQLQLQPAFKLKQPVLQPLALYGSGPSTRQQLAAICQQFQQTADQFVPVVAPWLGFGEEERKNLKAQQQMPEVNTDAETIPQEILPKTPAATVPLPEHRFYTIAGQPQFFGNVDILQNPLRPIFSIQTLQAIRARSVADPLLSMAIQAPRNPSEMDKGSEMLPLALPLQSSQQLIQEQPLLIVDPARNFAKALEEKNIANLQLQALQSEQAVIEADAFAQKFASRFDNDQGSEKLKQDSQQSNAENQQPAFAAAKSVDSLQEMNAAQLADQNAAQAQSEQQQQIKIIEEDRKQQTAEK